jgi:hypothetical protein
MESPLKTGYPRTLFSSHHLLGSIHLAFSSYHSKMAEGKREREEEGEGEEE